MNQTWLVLYDITDSKRLAKVAKILELEGIRMQKSLFECTWSQARGILIEEMIKEVVDVERDYVLFIPRCSPDVQKAIKLGKGSETKEDHRPFRIL